MSAIEIDGPLYEYFRRSRRIRDTVTVANTTPNETLKVYDATERNHAWAALDAETAARVALALLAVDRETAQDFRRALAITIDSDELLLMDELEADFHVELSAGVKRLRSYLATLDTAITTFHR